MKGRRRPGVRRAVPILIGTGTRYHNRELVSMPVGPPPKSKADSILNHGAAVAPFGSPSSFGSVAYT